MTKSNLNKEYDYIESISNSIGKKLKNNDKLTEEEMEDLVKDIALFEDYEIICTVEKRLEKFMRDMTTVIKINNKLYAIDWRRGNTAYQYDMFENQPYECELEEIWTKTYNIKRK